MKFSFPSAPFRFATLTFTTRWEKNPERKRQQHNNQHSHKSTKFVSGLDPDLPQLTSPNISQ